VSYKRILSMRYLLLVFALCLSACASRQSIVPRAPLNVKPPISDMSSLNTNLNDVDSAVKAASDDAEKVRSFLRALTYGTNL
jgi:hypothetical protein